MLCVCIYIVVKKHFHISEDYTTPDPYCVDKVHVFICRDHNTRISTIYNNYIPLVGKKSYTYSEIFSSCGNFQPNIRSK